MTLLPWLDDSRAADPATCGGKGANLARLAAGGFRVPKGFVIPAQLTAPLLVNQPLTPDAADAVRSALSRLGPETAVAVRSSGLDEDSAGRSFAGQHLTVLGVSGVDAVIDAIGECARSVLAEGALAYRASTGADADARIAVIVQAMIEPDLAGVAFSVDPLTGDASRIVVEAVKGRGVALVDGTAEADRVVVDRSTMAVLEEQHPGVAVLSADHAIRVAHAAVDAERLFGSPQDIEFAISGGTLWMLQSRPVTVTPAPSTDRGWTSEFDSESSEDDLWTSANIQEVLPGLLTPLTMSAFQENATQAYTIGYQEVRLLKKDEWPQFVGLFYNRAYLNVAAARKVAERAIGSNGDMVEHRFLGGEMTSNAPRGNRLVQWRDKLWSAPFLLKMSLTINRAVAKAERQSAAWERRMRNTRFERLSDAEIEKLRADAMYFAADTVKVHLRISGMAGTGFEWVVGLVKPVLGDETEGTVPSLFSGMRGVESAQISLDLWDLAQAARADGLADALMAEDFDPHDSTLPPSWRQRFDAFIERHGHRGLNEMEIAAKPWRRDHGPVIQILRAYLGMDPANSPSATLDRQEAERERLTAELASKMNPLKRVIFRRFLRDAQSYVATRERMKSVIVRSMRLAEYMLPDLERRIVSAGCVEKGDDIFFLTQDELRGVLAGDRTDFRTAVLRRRREYERNRHILLPERFRGHPAPIVPESHAAGTTTLTGTPVSPGFVTAKARVILDPQVDRPLEPGEILVAPVTDAGWTPLFALASGLVVDMGSALSHGSTVAREYGLPAVVNVRGGTRIIRTGDLVTIDGAKGTVVVVPADQANNAK